MCLRGGAIARNEVHKDLAYIAIPGGESSLDEPKNSQLKKKARCREEHIENEKFVDWLERNFERERNDECKRYNENQKQTKKQEIQQPNIDGAHNNDLDMLLDVSSRCKRKKPSRKKC